MNKLSYNSYLDNMKKRTDCIVIIKGDSMFPTLKNNDMVKIIKKDSYQIRDIVMFYYCEKKLFVVHRIVSFFDNKYSLMGDNAYSIEKNIYFEDIVGKVCCKIIKGNNVYISDFSNKFISKINIKELYLFDKKKKIFRIFFKLLRLFKTCLLLFINLFLKKEKI